MACHDVDSHDNHGARTAGDRDVLIFQSAAITCRAEIVGTGVGVGVAVGVGVGVGVGVAVEVGVAVGDGVGVGDPPTVMLVACSHWFGGERMKSPWIVTS